MGRIVTDPASNSMADSAKQLRRVKASDLSARASEISRYILFGVLALGYGIYSGEDAFSRSIVQHQPLLLRLAVITSFLGVIFDFAQYNAGYRAADAAFLNAAKGYDYKKRSFWYVTWNLSYYLKQMAVILVCLLLILLSQKVVFGKPERPQPVPRVSYVLFESGEDRVSDIFYPLVADIAKGATSDKVKLIEIDGSADSTGDLRRNLDLSLRRAQRVRQLLIDMGVPERKLRARGMTVASAQSHGHEKDMTNRAARILLTIE
jgi:outer membrane protein OmpA-like peptidoglycan-associated protein